MGILVRSWNASGEGGAAIVYDFDRQVSPALPYCSFMLSHLHGHLSMFVGAERPQAGGGEGGGIWKQQKWVSAGSITILHTCIFWRRLPICASTTTLQ